MLQNKLSQKLLNDEPALNYLQKHFSNIKKLAKGGFATVYSAETPDNRQVALKIIPKNKSWKIEEKVWPQLKHCNILPVIEIRKNSQYIVYVTPKHPTTLHQITLTSNFKKDKNSMYRIKKWLSDILIALDYLHTQNFCHLDIKPDNILISDEDSAILFDFSGINLTQIHLDRLVSPPIYNPPEFFHKTGVEGSKFDMWSFGLLVLDLLTNRSLTETLNGMTGTLTWESKLESVLKEALEEIPFNSRFDETFRYIWVSEEDKMQALDFVRSLLTIDPTQRPTAAEALKHPFLHSPDIDSPENTQNSPTKTVHENSPLENIPTPRAIVRYSIKVLPPQQPLTDHPEQSLLNTNPPINSRNISQNRFSIKKMKNWFNKQLNKFPRKKQTYTKLINED